MSRTNTQKVKKGGTNKYRNHLRTRKTKPYALAGEKPVLVFLNNEIGESAKSYEVFERNYMPLSMARTARKERRIERNSEKKKIRQQLKNSLKKELMLQ